MSESGNLFDLTEFEEAPSRPLDGLMGEDEDLDAVVVRVLPDVSGITKEFDYLADPSQMKQLEIGSLVRVELNGRRISGWVTAVDLERTAGVGLRRLVKVSSVGPSEEILDLARWTADRWHGRVGALLKTATPPVQVKALPAAGTTQAPDTTVTAPATVPEPDSDLNPVELSASGSVVVVQTTPNEDVSTQVAKLAKRGDVIVVAPRLGMAQSLAGRLRRQGVAARLYPRDWAAAAGRGGVVLGARSAVWARVRNLGAIVVLDEHDEALAEERNPTWNARDVAVERARRAGVTCYLLSPGPSLAARALTASAPRSASHSEIRAEWPLVEVADRREDEPGRTGLFSSRLAQIVREPGSVLAVLNRKGRSVMSACATCGELVRTVDGERLMVERDGVLICPSTQETRPVVCAVCGSTSLKRLRLGVTRAAEELAGLTGEPVDFWTATEHETRRSPSRVVVGTEAALHALTGVQTVVFLDFDAELTAPRYRAAEQAFALMLLAARLVGARRQGGRILVQTRMPEHRVIEAATKSDPGRFAESEASIRRTVGWPPFGALAEISGAGADEFVQSLSPRPGADQRIMGPNDDGRFLVRASTPDELAELLRNGRRPTDRFRVAVDPLRV